MGVLRFALALFVVFWHTPGLTFRPFDAVVAVAGFFIISGFYMAMIISETYRKVDRKWIGAFYQARLLRIYVPYWVVGGAILLMFVTTGAATPFTLGLPLTVLQNIEIVVINVTLVGFDLFSAISISLDAHQLPYFLQPMVDLFRPRFFYSGPLVFPIGQAWSLSSELAFYLIAPFIVWSPRRTLIAVVATLAIRGLLIGVLGLQSDLWGYRFFPATACLFLLGSLGYHLAKSLSLGQTTRRLIGAGALALFATWLTVSVRRQGMMLPENETNSIDQPIFWAFYVSLALTVPFIFELTRANRWDRALGDISYPLYLSHGIVLGIIFNNWHAPRGTTFDMVLAIFFCIVVAYGLRCFVDDKVDVLRHRLARRELRSAVPDATPGETRPAPRLADGLLRKPAA